MVSGRLEIGDPLWLFDRAFRLLDGLGLAFALTLSAFVIGSFSGFLWEFAVRPVDDRATRDRYARLYGEAQLRLQLVPPVGLGSSALVSSNFWYLGGLGVAVLLVVHGMALHLTAKRAPLRTDLAGKDLSHASLVGANCANLDMGNTNLEGANLRGANLNGADLTGARIREAVFAKVDLTETEGLRVADLRKVSRDLHGVGLYRQYLKGCRLEKANLSGADLRGATLIDARLDKANLTGAWLQEIDEILTDLTGAHLPGASLRSADLRGALLCGADLTRARLVGARLSGADLSGAILRGADLTGANLTGAKLGGAHLDRDKPTVSEELASEEDARESSTGVSLKGLTRTVLRRANLSETIWSCTDLSGADMQRVELKGATFTDVTFRDVDFDGVDFDGVKLLGVVDVAGASFSGCTNLEKAEFGTIVGEAEWPDGFKPSSGSDGRGVTEAERGQRQTTFERFMTRWGYAHWR